MKDGYPAATVSDDGVRPYALAPALPETIVLPLHILVERCHDSIEAVARLLKLTPPEALVRAIDAMNSRDYGHAVTAARGLFIDYRGGALPTRQEVFSMVDALSDIHRTFHAEVHRLCQRPFRRLRYLRSIANDALVFDAIA